MAKTAAKAKTIAPPKPAPAKKVSHRPAIFRNKKVRVQGMITKNGSIAFEQRRQQLAKLAGWDAKKVSDADVIDYLARGEISTKLYLKGEIKE